MHHSRFLRHHGLRRRGDRGGADDSSSRSDPTFAYDYRYHYSRRYDDDDDYYRQRNSQQGSSGGGSNTYDDDEYRALTAGNYTYTASVTIRVTPHDDYMVSWGILWGLFVLASAYAAYQVLKERRILRARQGDEGGFGGDPSLMMSAGGMLTTGDGEGVSTADETRALFRRLILLAMVTRVVAIPIQIWSDPVWCQFFADTLPEMVFASAWTTLVSFWVQLVGLAAGVGTNTSPSIVIQATAYVVYCVLLVTQVWNAVATVLLYALLCCIYAALFGTGAYFCPVLLSLLKPSLAGSRHYRGLAARLVASSALVMAVFLAHTVGYARLVVAPPVQVQWWWKYGALELLPSVLFLTMMSPSSNKARRHHHNAGEATTPTPPHEHKSAAGSGGGGFRRVDSTGSTGSVGGGLGAAAYTSRSSGAGHRRAGSGAIPAAGAQSAPAPSQSPTPPPPAHPPSAAHHEATGLLRGSGAVGGYGSAVAASGSEGGGMSTGESAAYASAPHR